MTSWSKVSQIEAGHFDIETAYTSVDRHRIGDNKPYIYRTHDGGKTWRNIVNGIPEGAYVNSVKEDPKTKGLLYAATELRVYVSFNDGAQWQPLQNNMPVTSIRDIIVHGDDLDVATYGRGFWVMDQMTALREIANHGDQITSTGVYLFKPGESLAIRPGGMNGTPLPHEEPQELNPPAGVLAYYWLKTTATQPLKVELLDSKGTVRACSASDAPVHPVDTEAINVQAVSQELARPLSTEAGMHRVALNVVSPRGGGQRGAPELAAKDACSPLGETLPPTPTRPARGQRGGPIALQPGDYTVRLTVDGQIYTQPVTVKPDPRGTPIDHANEGAANRS
jgi:hypothetical protein